MKNESEQAMNGQQSNKKFRVLSISGGGTRGLIPSIILTRLEQITGRHPTEMFDLFIGTSTGAMITAVLNVPNDVPVPTEVNKEEADTNEGSTEMPPKWKYAAKDLIDIYVKEGPIVFESSLMRRWSTGNGIWGHLFDTKKRDERFKAWMGDIHLKDTVKDVILTSYERCTESPIFFKTRKAQMDAEHDYLLTDCIKAATAAPSVWPYYLMRNGLYMDALHAKNPSMFAVFEANHYYSVPYEDVLLVSLGTGYIKDHVDPKNVLTSGLGFYKDTFHSTINANTKCFMHMVKGLIGKVRTLDVDIPLPESHMGITDVSKDHINYMIKATHEYLVEHEEEIKEFARLLIPESEWIVSAFDKSATKTLNSENPEVAQDAKGAFDKSATETLNTESAVKLEESIVQDGTK